MARRKKRILFDVMGGGSRSRKGRSGAKKSSAAMALPKRKKKAPARSSDPVSLPSGSLSEGEIRITSNLAIALGFAFVVIVAVSYYLGSVTGSRDEGSGDVPPVLRSETDRGPSKESVSRGTVYSIRACMVRFNELSVVPYTNLMKKRAQFLRSEGFEHVDLRIYEDKEKGKKLLQLWVGLEANSAPLRRTASDLRKMRVEGESKNPFRNALVLTKR